MLVEWICSFYDIIQVILLYATICKIFYERSVLCSAKADRYRYRFSVWSMRRSRDFYFDGAENCSAWALSAHILPLVRRWR